ncbi:MAG: transcription-repair coupling factor, partial [Verrucomicrobia bacterium]|nr:transcription-repair coupling factor [Verrucomicrobiota bacterium]
MSDPENPTFSYLLDDQLFPPGSALPLDGVEASALPFLVHWLRCQRADQPILVVTGGTRAQEAFHQDLCAWHSMDEEKNGPQPDYFPSWEVLPAEDRLPEADTLGERLKTLLHLREHPEKACIVAQVDSILQKTFSRSNFQERLREVKMGAAVDPLELLDWLEAQGYEPVNKVTQKGEFAVRGGIVDFYPLSAAWPIRLEFFRNEID